MADGDARFLPSRDLRPLRANAAAALLTLDVVDAGLTHIAQALGVFDEPDIFFPAAVAEEIDDDDAEDDATGLDFELKYARTWLTKIVASDLDGFLDKNGDEDHARREALITRAAELLAVCAGKSAAGQSRVRYLFETRSGTSVSVRAQEATLTNDALGGRTWGAAPLLARHLVSDAASLELLDTATAANRPLRVLELGAGTGLVGLALARLVRSGPQSQSEARRMPGLHLVLTDHHPHVLVNLRETVALNELELDSPAGAENRGVAVQIRKLDWQAVYNARQGASGQSSYSSTAQTLPENASAAMDADWLKPIPFDDGSVDILIAADCVYDPLHPFWIRAVADKYLCKTSGVLHMISPVRSTHHLEMAAMYQAFQQQPDAGNAPTEGHFSIIKEEVLHGYDDFGPPRLRLGPVAREPRRMQGTKTVYRRFEIQWTVL